MLRKLLSGLSLVSILVLTSCYPGGADSTRDLDIVMTHFENSFDFSGKTTYALIDSIVHIGDDNGELGRALDNDILARVNSNLLDRNYEKYDTTNTPANTPPNYLVRVSLLKITAEGSYCSYYPGYNWGWWGGWGYWYGGYPGYGYGYGWCGGYYSYDIGTLVIEMVDLTDATTADDLQVVWMGLANGIASGNPLSNRDRILGAIDQAFDQSPYLKP
ncbi:MAG: DUF4136 domain-containing protein [Flavobacteriia bacterium]|nr:DUF4136 domain-containing protein [Flavobacteriia bacterium]